MATGSNWSKWSINRTDGPLGIFFNWTLESAYRSAHILSILSAKHFAKETWLIV